MFVPVYNAKEYLRRCVDSILGQEYTDFELLLIDDGSQDGSGAICDEYAAKDMRVRVIHKENGGVSAARNLAMKTPGEPIFSLRTATTGSRRTPRSSWCARQRRKTATW